MHDGLLTAEQELALAWRIRGMNVLVPRPGDQTPTPAQACNRLVEQNLALVQAVARRYWRPPMPMEDLVQEGALALRAAVERFDPERGCRFSTFAFPWVQRGVSRAAQEWWAPIRCPPEARDRRWVVVSYDQPTHESDGEPLLVALPDPGPAPDWQQEQRTLAGLIHDALERLPSKERSVLSLSFGLGVDRAHTPAEVAELVGLSRPTVLRLLERGLSRLRRDRLSYELQAFAA